MTKEITVKILISIFNVFKRPKEIRSDLGPSFRDKYVQEMQSLGIDTQFSAAYNAIGNVMAVEAVSKFKTIQNHNISVSNAKIQELVSSLNNATSSVAGAGSASEHLLGWKP